VSKYVFTLVLAALAAHAQATAIRPDVPCDRPIFVFGDATVLGRGVRMLGRNDLASRLKVFFRRVCDKEPRLEVVAQEHGRLVDAVVTIGDTLARNHGALAFVHYTFADVESDVPADLLLVAYRRLGEVCRSTVAICIVGGQQPVESLAQKAEAWQLEIEQQAAATLGGGFVPLYRHFRSEAGSRRLMVPLDSGDGRFVNDAGHELLFELYRRRLIELVQEAQDGGGGIGVPSTVR